MPKKAYVFTKPCNGCGEPQRMTYLLKEKMALMLASHFEENGVSCVPCATKQREETEAAISAAKVSLPQTAPAQQEANQDPQPTAPLPPEPTPEAPLA